MISTWATVIIRIVGCSRKRASLLQTLISTRGCTLSTQSLRVAPAQRVEHRYTSSQNSSPVRSSLRRQKPENDRISLCLISNSLTRSYLFTALYEDQRNGWTVDVRWNSTSGEHCTVLYYLCSWTVTVPTTDTIWAIFFTGSLKITQTYSTLYPNWLQWRQHSNPLITV